MRAGTSLGIAAALVAGAAIGAGTQRFAAADVSSGDRPVLVTIEPCRLADTRPVPNQVGSRSTPLGAGDVHTVSARAIGTPCSGKVPTDALALSLNVTALNASALSFLTIWAGGERPLAASLNPAPGEPPVPNAVTTRIDGNQDFSIYNNAGSVDVVIDVNGYYVNHNHDDAYSPAGHAHTGVYAPADHGHPGVYAPADHGHAGVYATADHGHAGVYAPVAHDHPHDHNSQYEPIVTVREITIDVGAAARQSGGFSPGSGVSLANGASLYPTFSVPRDISPGATMTVDITWRVFSGSCSVGFVSGGSTAAWRPEVFPVPFTMTFPSPVSSPATGIPHRTTGTIVGAVAGDAVILDIEPTGSCGGADITGVAITYT